MLQGVATVSAGGVSGPLASEQLSISTPGNAYSGPGRATVMTGTDGSFSYTAPGSPAGVLSYTISQDEFGLSDELTVRFGVNAVAQIASCSGALSAPFPASTALMG